jgi:hypothetical protein
LTKSGGLYIDIDITVQIAVADWGSREPAERKHHYCFDPWNLIQVILAKESRYISFFSCGFICPTNTGQF